MQRDPGIAFGRRLRIFGRSLSPNIWIQVITSLLGGFYRGAFVAVWQPFVLYLRDSITFLGLLESVGGWGGIISCLMQLLGGWMADRLGRRPTLILSSSFVVLSLSCLTLAALLHRWSLLIPGVVLAGAGLLGRAAQSSITAESVREERRGLAYSLTMFAFVAPGVISSVVGGTVAERWGYLPVMLTSLILEALILVLLACFIRETLVGRRGRPVSRGDWHDLLRLLTIPRKLWRLAIPFAGDALSFGIAGSILFGILKDGYRFTDGQLGWINAFFYLSWAVAQLPAGRLVDRYGCKRFLVLAEAGMCICLVVWLLWPNFVGVSIAYLLLGVTAALWVPALLTLLAGTVSENERGATLGRIFTVQSLARFPTPYLASLLYKRWGYPAPIVVGLGGAVLVVISMLLLIQDPPATHTSASADGGPPR